MIVASLLNILLINVLSVVLIRLLNGLESLATSDPSRHGVMLVRRKVPIECLLRRILSNGVFY
jgi:hypothetical protein